MKKRIRKRRFNVRVGLPKGITQPAYNEPRQSAMDYFMNYESVIEQAIDQVLVALSEHDYIDGEGYQLRPRIKRKGTPKNKGFKKEPYVVYR